MRISQGFVFFLDLPFFLKKNKKIQNGEGKKK